MSEVFSVSSAESEQQTYTHHPLSKLLERRAEMQLFPHKASINQIQIKCFSSLTHTHTHTHPQQIATHHLVPYDP
jgi:hypothetical protein